MNAVKSSVYMALGRLERFISQPEPSEMDPSGLPFYTAEEARKELSVVEAEIEHLAKAYDAFGRFPSESFTAGYYSVPEQAVRDLARYRVKYERVRVAVRVLNKILRERRVAATTARYAHLLEVVEALTWKLGQHEGQAAGYTWIRFDTREDYENYAKWKSEHK